MWHPKSTTLTMITILTWITIIADFICVTALISPLNMHTSALLGVQHLYTKPSLSSSSSSSFVAYSSGGRFMSTTSNMDGEDDITNNNNKMMLEDCHDVVLFGVGDMRVDDHGGLLRAIQLQHNQNKKKTTTKIHCCFLCTDQVLLNTCGMISHTVDTVNCIVSAMHELDNTLRQNNLGPLHCITSTIENDTTNKENVDIFKYIQNNIITPSSSSSSSSSSTKIRIHVCDLGPIDNEMTYGAYGQILLRQQQQQQQQQPIDDSLWEVVPWKNILRTEPWEMMEENYDTFPISYPQYQSQYTTSTKVVLPPETVSNTDISLASSTISTKHSIPTSEQILNRLQRLLPDEHILNDTINTGLYGTHFGGLSCTNNTVGCMSILQHLTTYCNTCNEDDAMFRQLIQNDNQLSSLIPHRNIRSLEHAAMIWQFEGNNWLDGEIIIRMLLVPLYLGTISPRRIWHMGGRPRQSYLQTTVWNSPPLRTLVEGREWHNLLAARHYYLAQNQPRMTITSPDSSSTTVPTPQYKYWRYHGLLCRYAQTDFAPRVNESVHQQKEGILLVHGFGASGSQWNKVMHELSNMATTTLYQGLAPDLIGFGQSEKPAVSYTSYMWDSQMMDFLKDVAIHRHQWETFVTGGNSIGGYTSMSFAACDAASTKEVTSSGSSGTGKCTGLVLMNSAGPLKTKIEIEEEMQAEGGNTISVASVAVTTATLKLPPCKPPPRPVARLFGNVLLSYLRPNIQSICRNLYPTNPAAVDDMLVQDIERDSLDPGAINVMMAGAKLPPPRTSNELLRALFGATTSNHNGVEESYFDGPVLIAQGVLDPLNNSTDRMERFQSLRGGIEIAPVQAGHCPHDELPHEIALSISSWRSALEASNVQSAKEIISSL